MAEHRLTDAEQLMVDVCTGRAPAPEFVALYAVDSVGCRREIDTSPQAVAETAAASRANVERLAPPPTKGRFVRQGRHEMRPPAVSRVRRTCVRPRERRDGPGRRSSGPGRRRSSSRAGPSDLDGEPEPPGRLAQEAGRAAS